MITTLTSVEPTASEGQIRNESHLKSTCVSRPSTTAGRVSGRWERRMRQTTGNKTDKASSPPELTFLGGGRGTNNRHNEYISSQELKGWVRWGHRGKGK